MTLRKVKREKNNINPDLRLMNTEPDLSVVNL